MTDIKCPFCDSDRIIRRRDIMVLIEACAKIAEDYDGLGMACGPNEQSGHAEITKDDIAKAIRGLARG